MDKLVKKEVLTVYISQFALIAVCAWIERLRNIK